jgi:hypothetical protein
MSVSYIPSPTPAAVVVASSTLPLALALALAIITCSVSRTHVSALVLSRTMDYYTLYRYMTARYRMRCIMFHHYVAGQSNIIRVRL